MASALLALSAVAAPPLAWVVESEQYMNSVRRNAPGWQFVWCGANGSRCDVRSPEASAVRAVVGRADALALSELPGLELVQSASWYPVDGAAVPAHAAITNFDIWVAPYYHPYSVANLGEFCVAAIFDDTYRLAARAESMRDCAFSDDAPRRCPAASTATNHTTVGSLTIGVLGYGRIGTQVAIRMAALGATVVATKRHGPFNPPPAPLKWLSDDNDRLLRTADVVVVTAPGSVHGLINKTSLALMVRDTHIAPLLPSPDPSSPHQFTFTPYAAPRRAPHPDRGALDRLCGPRGGAHSPSRTSRLPRRVAQRLLGRRRRQVRRPLRQARRGGQPDPRKPAQCATAAGLGDARHPLLGGVGHLRRGESRGDRYR